MKSDTYHGLLCIGDPHLASAAPGLRRDDYARAILDKLSHCFALARRDQLLPVLLGDVFHASSERDAALFEELTALLPDEVLAVFGNHDCSGDTLGSEDALARLARTTGVRLLDDRAPWTGELGGRSAIVGGTPWGASQPTAQEAPSRDGSGRTLVAWITHLDVCFPERGGEGIEPRPIPGVDLVVNGHHHTRYETLVTGATTWCNPGSIARYSGSPSARSREPTALRVDASAAGFELGWIPIPHRPAAEVFAAGPATG
jgi:predicted phosphodiesterase